MKIRICPKCLTSYDNSLNCCPKCQTRNPKYLPLHIFSIILLFVCMSGVYYFIHNPITFKFPKAEKTALAPDKPDSDIKQEDTENKPENQESLEKRELVKINIRPMSDLSYKSVDDILTMRKKYVNESPVFGNNGSYEPSKDVFQIEDNLPWISAPQISKYGIQNNPKIAEGISRHSLSINNPELLFAFLIPHYPQRPLEYASEADYMLPQKIVWLKPNNVIHADFDLSEFFNKNPQYNKSVAVHLEDTNARDMGYNWVYCDKTDNVNFTSPDSNISTDIYELKGFYHKGFACGLENGCNNYSPHQPELSFYMRRHGYIDCKLWKSKPLSKNSNPDFNYMMIW